MVSYLTSFVKNVLGYLGLYNKKANLMFLGLDNAGKSTLLHMVKTGKYTQTLPTGQPNSEELKMGNLRLNTYDLGGHATARKIWKDYFPAVDGIIFLIDSTDVARFDEVRVELENVLTSPELANIPIAILGNKIDKPGAVPEEDLKKAIDFYGLTSKDNRPMELFMCSIVKKIGYSKALEWLASFLKDD